MHEHQSSVETVHDLIDILSKKWVLLLVHALLMHEDAHFSELKKEVGGITPRMLSDRLQLLEEAQLLVRNVSATKPPEVTYSLTAKGKDLVEIYRAFAEWSEKWQHSELKEGQ